jgi:signal peptidase I
VTGAGFTFLTIGVMVVGVAAVVGLVGLRRRLLVVRVRGNSMLPTYRHDDVLLAVRRRIDRVQVGDVVVFDPPPPAAKPAAAGPEWMVKRVVAVPGDPLPESVPATDRVVPPHTLVVYGDNGGYDSRSFGLLDADRLLAVVRRRLAAAPDQGLIPTGEPVDPTQLRHEQRHQVVEHHHEPGDDRSGDPGDHHPADIHGSSDSPRHQPGADHPE